MTAVTIVDVAERAGVSIKTVSRVLNHEANVREETRARVLSAVEALSYRPNIYARVLGGRGAYLVGLLFNNPSQAYVAALQNGAMTACRKAGYHLLVEQVEAPAADLADRVREIVDVVALDGVILTSPMNENEEVLDLLDRAKIPYVRISPDRWLERSSYVHVDDREAARQMTRTLWALGHRDIGFVEGTAGHRSSRARRAGYQAALAELGAPERPELIAPGAFDARSGAAAGDRLLALKQRPTAIFASNDDMAMGVMAAAMAAGLRLPDDLAVAGFDDSPIARAVWPPLTTVRQPVADLAATAVDLLIGPAKAAGPTSRLLDFEIILRQSTAVLPAMKASEGPLISGSSATP